MRNCLGILILCLLLGCGKAQPVGNYTIVVTDRNQRPIADALVEVWVEVEEGTSVKTCALTDSTGLAYVPTVTVPSAKRTFTASALHPRYLDNRGAIRYQAGENVEGDTLTLVLDSISDIQAYRDDNPLRNTPDNAWVKFMRHLDRVLHYQTFRPLPDRAALAQEYRTACVALQKAYPLNINNRSMRQIRAVIDSIDGRIESIAAAMAQDSAFVQAGLSPQDAYAICLQMLQPAPSDDNRILFPERLTDTRIVHVEVGPGGDTMRVMTGEVIGPLNGSGESATLERHGGQWRIVSFGMWSS
jgi:hypothetical protein